MMPAASQVIRFVSVDLANFKIGFLSIIIGALPFIIIGVVVSALLENFVSEEMISRIFPSNRYLGILLACCLGIVFPICDCGIVPVARRLISKGVPLCSAVAFMLAAPIINPVVAASTAVAFAGDHSMVWWRLGLAFLVAYLTGLTLSFLVQDNPLNVEPENDCHGCGTCGPANIASSMTDKIKKTLLDAGNEFFEMGKYLIIGAFPGALATTFIPRQILLGIGYQPLLSAIVMVVFAFGVSVCSTADAFIAASFAASFSKGALLAFMVCGPMLDVKNTLMLLKAFKPWLVILMILIIFFLVVEGAFWINVL
jgi:uncharacterized membrane protein YraQ (UPF0718 family)